jgi:MYXO-CTERM domain-containing protein
MMTRKLIQTAIGVAAIFLSNAAMAGEATEYVLQLGANVGRPEPFPPAPHKNAGPGAEQAVTTTLNKGGSLYVVTVWMSSDVDRRLGPNQLKCTSLKMDPIQGPVKVADQVQLTHLQGNRPANHPFMAGADDLGSILLAYGSNDANQTNVQTYAMLINEQCSALTAVKAVRISNDANNNEGAPHVVYNGGGFFSVGYYQNGGQRTYMRGVQVSGTTITKTFLNEVGANNDIGRPYQAALSSTRTLSCFAHGNQRPPERGVQCTLVDVSTGTNLWTQYVVRAQPSDWPGVTPGVYYNMPYIFKLDANRVVINMFDSTGEGERRNKKGSNVEHMFLASPTDTALNVGPMASGYGSYQSHSAMCTTSFGAGTPQPTAVVMDTPRDDNGVAMLHFIGFNGTTQMAAMMPGIKKVASAEASSGGLLSNLYGQNPNNQGRDFMNCIGDVANPGYHVANGFQPDVKSFVAVPHGSRMQGEYKNGLAITFMPSTTDQPLPPDPGPGPGGMNGNGGGIGGNGTDPNGGSGNPSGNGSPNNTSAPSMWGCSVSHGSSPAGALIVLVVAGALVISRRKRS